jgi:glycine oxidase
MKDYLIIGCGLAGIAFAEKALQHQKTITVFENYSQNSSKVAGGLYNPVILKRFSEVWNAQEQLQLLQEFYQQIEKKLQTQFDFPVPILRKIYSVQEQNDWFLATDKPNLSLFLSSEINYVKYQGIDSPFGYGEVLQSGYVDTTLLLQNYQDYLVKQNLLTKGTFNYDKLSIYPEYVCYQDEQYKHIIFAEGFGIHANPFFSCLPLDGTKGELLVIKAPNLKLDAIIKSSVFILPIGNDLYKVGATYNWKDKTAIPTEEGKKELLDSLKNLLNCDFEVINHLAGVRPTVKDRRPLVGTHPNHPRIHVLNGLGTRGVMLAPSMAKSLYDKIEHQIPLSLEIDIQRLKKINWN